MEVNLLGPLVVEEQSMSIVPTARKPRQVLALLALNADRIVTVPTLMEEIWGDAIPRSAATTLQTYILQLRRMIAAALCVDPEREAKDVLVTKYGGYMLQVRPGRSDAEEFTRLAAAGRTAAEAGDDEGASDLLTRGLNLWRGAALVDVWTGRVLELEVLALEEARMSALERRIEADLRLGRHSELLGELRVLAAQHPMHENLCVQLMLALYRSGHVGRALESFQALRRTLADELGIEPSARVQRVQHAILCADPSLDRAEDRRTDFLART
ncbi:MAG TPA: AfsR/SARP family transcriptional regulator [Actinocrinis sp.]|jgi:DNA-binding SARP family transcriptional activator